MGFTFGGKRGFVSDVNVVPLIDILLVLLVIFMIIPHRQLGLPADLPQASKQDPGPLPEAIIVTVTADGSLRINRLEIQREELRGSLERIFAPRAFVLRSFRQIGLSNFMRWPRFWILCTPPALPRSVC